MLSTRRSPVPELEGISKEGFVLYKALSQPSSWESCDSNPFICSPCRLMKLLPNMLIYPCMPTYSTELEWDFFFLFIFFDAKTLDLDPDICIQTHTSLTQMSTHLRSSFMQASKFPHVPIQYMCAHMTWNPSAGSSFGSSCFCASPGCHCELERRLLCLL